MKKTKKVSEEKPQAKAIKDEDLKKIAGGLASAPMKKVD